MISEKNGKNGRNDLLRFLISKDFIFLRLRKEQ